MSDKLRVFLVDDEPLALKRLSRLLEQTGRVEIIGRESDPQTALDKLDSFEENSLDALFLDVQMPEMNGFQLLSHLTRQPIVVFTTAFDKYALQAFEVNSIDYLLKPIEAERLEKALNKLEHLRKTYHPQSDFQSTFREIAQFWQNSQKNYPTRIASKIGNQVRFSEIESISHFYAEDKLTFAATERGNFIVDRTITELEAELNPQKFVRIHRAALLNLDFVEEVNSWFGGRLIIKLKGSKNSQLTVARDRVRHLKEKMGF